jgi:hypothetical protein
MEVKFKQLQEHVDNRFDRLEDKLDLYTAETTRNSNDLTWIKGYVRISITLFISAISYVISQVFGIHLFPPSK